MPSVRLVTVWSGPLPRYLPLFLLTAARNPTVEFLFVADTPAPAGLLDGGLPENVVWVEMRHDDLVARLGAGVGLDLAGVDVSPYKLCDYKPTFGRGLAEFLSDVDFWGHVDCDLALGDVRAFATDDVLRDHDVVGFRGWNFVHGPLTLYRNDDAVNSLYTYAEGWERSLGTSRMLAFTETCGVWAWKGETRGPETPDSFTDAVGRAAEAGRVRVYDEDHVNEDDPRTAPVSLTWTTEPDGRPVLYDELARRPVAYYHLLGAKKTPLFRVPAWRALPDAFTVTNAGVRALDESRAQFHLERFQRGAVPFVRAVTGRVRAGVERRLPTGR